MRTVLLVALLMLSLSAPAQQTTGSSIAGTVVDSISRRPLAGVTLLAVAPGGGGPQPVTTAPDGRFTFENLPATRVAVTGSKPGYAITNLPFTMTPGLKIADAVFRMDPTGVISGRLTDGSGRPLVDAAVQARTLGRALPRRAYTTNDRGEFRIIDLAPGLYYVAFGSGAGSLQGTGFEPPPPNSFGTTLYPGVTDMARAIPVEVKSGEETRLRDTTLTVSRPGVVRLRVTNDTGNASEAQVVLEVSEGRQTRVVSDLFDVAESWKELRKEYFPSIPGTYTATAASTVAGVSGATTFEFTGGDVDVTVSLTAGTGKLTGKIMLLSQGSEPKPASDVHVLLNLDPGPPGWSFPVNATDGTFDLTDLPFGRYELRLTNLPADSYLSSVRQGERDALNNGVLIQQDQTHVDVTLSSGLATVQGKVTNSENRVVHGAMVVLMPETPGRTVGYRTDRTDQNGAYQLRNLVPGTYRLYAFIARNDDSFAEPSFLRQFEDKGKPVTVERRSQLSLDLKGIE